MKNIFFQKEWQFSRKCKIKSISIPPFLSILCYRNFIEVCKFQSLLYVPLRVLIQDS